MAPWCHVQSAKVVRRPPPLLEVRTPIYSYRYLGKKKVNAQQITSKYCDTGAIELPILGDDQTMQIYGRFEGFPFNSALFGFII